MVISGKLFLLLLLLLLSVLFMRYLNLFLIKAFL